MNTEFFEAATIRLKTSSRGGGIEINLGKLGYKKYEGYGMTAYQNYLGGGMLGRVNSDCNFPNWEENNRLVKLSEELKKYFHNITNPDEDEFESMSYEKNQSMPVSAY